MRLVTLGVHLGVAEYDHLLLGLGVVADSVKLAEETLSPLLPRLVLETTLSGATLLLLDLLSNLH